MESHKYSINPKVDGKRRKGEQGTNRTNEKIIDLNLIVSVITLNVNDPNMLS